MIDMQQVLVEVKKNGRVCPNPKAWQKIYEMLPNKIRKGSVWEPSLPLILSAWSDSPAMLKMLRLQEHIEWAAANGCLELVHDFLKSLPEDEWHHVDE